MQKNKTPRIGDWVVQADTRNLYRTSSCTDSADGDGSDAIFAPYPGLNVCISTKFLSGFGTRCSVRAPLTNACIAEAEYV